MHALCVIANLAAALLPWPCMAKNMFLLQIHPYWIIDEEHLSAAKSSIVFSCVELTGDIESRGPRELGSNVYSNYIHS